MTMYLDRLLDERASLTGVMTSLRDKAATEERDPTEAERTEIARMQERCVAIDAQLTEHEAQAASARAFADLSARIEKGRAPVETRGAAGLESTSPGRDFVGSPQFRAYPGRGQMGAFEVADYLGFEARAAITTANLAIQPFVFRPLAYESSSPLLDVMGHVRVDSGLVEWIELGGDPMAAVVPEGTAKPEATFTATPKSATLDTIAHWVQITRQALADASYMQSLLEGKLRRGLLNKVEADAAAMLGASTAIQTAAATAAQGGMSAAIRTGIGKVEASGYRPNAVVMNPADYAALDLADALARNAGAESRTSYWGLPIVSAAAIAAGNAYVGDFPAGFQLFDRGVSDVFVTDSHASLFISNILVILAETRVKSAITDPLALCECTVTP